MNFLKQFENKFIPFDIAIKAEKFLPYDVVNSPIPLKAMYPKEDRSDSVSINIVFDVVTSDNKNVAEVHLDFDYSGYIYNQMIKYYSPDNLTLCHLKDTSRFAEIPNEFYAFTKTTEKGVDELKITQVGKNVVGAYMAHSEGIRPRSFSKKLNWSLFAQPDYIGDFLLYPYNTQGANSSLVKYQALKAKFKEKCKLALDCSDQEYEYEIACRTNYWRYLTSDDKKRISQEISINSSLDDIAIYLSDPSNDLLRGFKGNYVGSILCESLDESIDTPSPLIVVTEQEKNGNTYRCYYLLENSDVETIRKTNQELKKDPKKYLKYVTQTGENGEEKLFLYNGQPVSEDCQEGHDEYNKFVEEFITPFSGIQPIKIEQFMLKSRDLSNSQR